MAQVPSEDEAQSRNRPEPPVTQGIRRQRAEIQAESLGSQIRQLTLSRQASYDRARTYRRDGQLVPASLREDIAENGHQLRQALERYTETICEMPAPASWHRP
jgi:hypothetical protein